MIPITTHLDSKAFQIIADSCKIAVEVIFNRLIDEGLPVFRAKNNVQIVFC